METRKQVSPATAVLVMLAITVYGMFLLMQMSHQHRLLHPTTARPPPIVQTPITWGH